MYRPSTWKRAWRVRSALANYPLYSPPHRQHPWFLDFDSAKEDGQYFFEQRTERVRILSEFLRAFNVDLALEGPGLAAVSAWFAEYAGLAVPNLRSRAIRQAFYRMARPWTGRLRGFNAIFDLGLFFGECVIARNPGCYWHGFFGAAPGAPPRPVQDIGGMGIVIFGSRRKPCFDPFALVEVMCSNFQAFDRISGMPRGPGRRDTGKFAHFVEIYGDTKAYPGEPF